MGIWYENSGYRLTEIAVIFLLLIRADCFKKRNQSKLFKLKSCIISFIHFYTKTVEIDIPCDSKNGHEQILLACVSFA